MMSNMPITAGGIWWSTCLSLSCITLFAIGGGLVIASCSKSSSDYCDESLWTIGIILLGIAGLATVLGLFYLAIHIARCLNADDISSSSSSASASTTTTSSSSTPLHPAVQFSPHMPLMSNTAPLPVPHLPAHDSKRLRRGRTRFVKPEIESCVVEVLTPVGDGDDDGTQRFCGKCWIHVQSPFCGRCGTQIIDV